MTIPARTWQGQPITVTALENYERTFFGSDGFLYLETNDSLGSLEFGSGLWSPPHAAMEEYRVHKYNLCRLDAAELVGLNVTGLLPETGEGCVYYKPSINGNVMDTVYDSPEKAVDALMLEILPVGSRIYPTADRLKVIKGVWNYTTDAVDEQGWFTLARWATDNLEMYGITAIAQQSLWLSTNEMQIDWDKTFAWLEKQGAA